MKTVTIHLFFPPRNPAGGARGNSITKTVTILERKIYIKWAIKKFTGKYK